MTTPPQLWPPHMCELCGNNTRCIGRTGETWHYVCDYCSTTGTETR